MLDFLVSWVMVFHPVVAIFILAVIVLFIINLCYKYLMNQNEVKKIKDRSKEMNKEWKKYQKEGNTEKAKAIMSEMMAENNKMMMMTFKPMLVSMILVILILPGLAGIYGNVEVQLKDGSGTLENKGQSYEITGNGESISIAGSESIECKLPCREKIGDSLWNVRSNGKNIMFERVVALLPVPLPLFGDDLGWLGWYFICSIPLMLLIKKILKVNI
ncbi:MAG: DUF106 domain-containing protein [Candidatus Aenigmarchaeota archaeon]|nr:DUF106 domain-containing protein [Candidatus Aenigmarchaeota archaeon]